MWEKIVSQNRRQALAFATLGLLGFALLLAVGTTGAQTAASPPIYVGVPQNLNATYFEEFRYVVVVNGTPVSESYGGSGGFNLSFTLIPQPYATSFGGVVLRFPFQVNVYNVQVSEHYNSTFALKRPPEPTVISGSEYAYNYSMSPYFIISPNAPTRNYTSSELNVPYFNISVIRLSSWSYSYGSISFNGPAIEQITVYQPPPTGGGSVLVKNVYFYDAKSGLLIYWTNMTLNVLQNNTYVNITSNVYLVQTNLNNINPSGNAFPLQPTLPTKPSGSTFSPLFIALLVVVVVLVIVVVIAFARRRR